MFSREKKSRLSAGGASWEHWGGVFGRALPYVTLAAALLLTLLQPELSQRERGEIIVLSAAAAVWVYIFYTRSGPGPQSRPLLKVIYFAGFLVLAAALMSRHAIFFLFAVTGFIHAAVLRPWPLVFLGVGLTSTLINTMITGFPWPERDTWVFYGALITFQTLGAGLSILFVEKVTGLSEERKQAVERLEAALKENAGLQAQLVTQAREAGILEERQRLAREIHDTLAQGLTGIITQLGAFQQANDLDRRQRHFDNALRLARESLAEARRSVHALRPGPLAGAPLPQALEEVAREWSQIHGVNTEITITGDPVELSAEVEDALLRTAQEALANIAKHARATRTGITLSYMDDMVALDIRDDGVGFQLIDQREDGGEGFGMDSMRQRLLQVNGSIEIESEPGNGTAISARVPTAAGVKEQVFS